MSPGCVHGKRVARRLSWLLLLLLAALAACGEAAPTPFPTAAGVRRVVASPTPRVAQRYTNEVAGFSFELPDGWLVEEQGVTRLGRYYLMGPEPLGPGPGTSALFVAGAAELAPAEAAALLACEECETEPELEPATVGGLEAQRAMLGEPVAVEWYFIPHGEWLIFFTLHDPATLATREELLNSFRLEGDEPEEVAATQPTATPPPTPAPLPTSPPPPATPPVVTDWQEMTVTDAAITFAMPEGWETAGDNEWAPDSLSPLRLGFRWQDMAASAEEALPDGEIRASQPLTVTWGEGISVTLQTADAWERHAVLQVGLRSYDFYARGTAEASVEAMQPLLEHVVESAELLDQLLYVEEPVAGAVAWFAAALADAGGQGALPYMSAALKAQLEPGQSPLALLGLPQRPSVYQIEVLGEPGRFVDLQANLTLAGGDEAVRILRMAFDQQIGWRLDEIIVPEGTEGDAG
jgi:predicted small lipoprotein YifL